MDWVSVTGERLANGYMAMSGWKLALVVVVQYGSIAGVLVGRYRPLSAVRFAVAV